MISRPSFLALSLAVPALLLASCGKKDEGAGNSAKPSAPVAGQAPPAGTQWSDQVVATPEGGFRMGNPNAPVKLVEYGSFTCPHCRDFAAESEETIKSDYVNSGKLSYEYRPYVRDPIDVSVALLARCNGPEAFFPLAAQFFANQADMFTTLQSKGQAEMQAAAALPVGQRFVKMAQAAGLVEFAKQRGIAEDKAKSCLADTKAAEALAKNVDFANANYQIQGTPSLILNGQLLENTATWAALQPQLKDAGL